MWTAVAAYCDACVFRIARLFRMSSGWRVLFAVKRTVRPLWRLNQAQQVKGVMHPPPANHQPPTAPYSAE